ncbi:MAG: hypothetical protein RIS76_923 [Verrucomicrobiota bacterium]|jgi:nitrogen fixation protein FixH
MTATDRSPSTSTPFNPWPWALLAFFALLITTIASFVVFAVRQDMELVRPDYYEQELRHDRQMERVRRTAGLAGAITLAPSGNTILVDVPTATRGLKPSGTVHLYRPSDSRLDREVELAPDAAGRMSLDTGSLRPGLWKVRVAWSVGLDEFFREATLVIPTPAA